jgi:hypothetical protein
MSDAKKTIEINDRATAKAVADRVGVKWPVAQGKPPKATLWRKLVALGFEVKGSYLPKPAVKLAPVGVGKREYEITRTHTGKPNSKGERKALAQPETIRVSIGELREVLRAEGMKGSLGDSRIREAVAKLREAKKLFVGWEDVDIAQAGITPIAVAATEEPNADALAMLDAALAPTEPKAEAAKPVEKAPSKPRTPRNSRAKAKTPADAAEPVKA